MTLFYDDERLEALDGCDVVDLFAGPGGWSEGLHQLGRAGDVGIEYDRWACATRRAAGHRTVEADVAHCDPADYAPARGVIASPPCQAFSTAGKQHGRVHVDALLDAIDRQAWHERPSRDPRVWLVLEVGRWLDALRPRWVALEQVPAVLPLWDAYGGFLHRLGYSVWHGIVNAADYGVPQIRQRAVLMASLDHELATAPPPTHSRDGGELARWVTVAQAWGIDAGRVGFPRADDTGTATDGYRARDWRDVHEPAFTVTEKARSWWFERPATTICGDARMFAPGGHVANDGRDNAKMIGRSDNATTLDVWQALTLQGFRRDYPVRGVRSKRFEQIGNAIPPPLAGAVLAELLTNPEQGNR